METIELTCLNCKKVYTIDKEDSIPFLATSANCNWCIECEDSAKDDYFESYKYDEIIYKSKDKNQLNLL